MAGTSDDAQFIAKELKIFYKRQAEMNGVEAPTSSLEEACSMLGVDPVEIRKSSHAGRRYLDAYR